MNKKLIDATGLLVCITTFSISLVLFYYLSDAWFASVFASILSASMLWLGYIVLRLIYLATRR